MKCPACGKSLWFRLPECPHCHAALGDGSHPARPWTVGLPCWIFFALGLLNLLLVVVRDWAPGNAEMRESLRVSAPWVFYVRYAMPLLMMVLALFMLNGRNWARWVFVVWFGNSLFWQVLKAPRDFWPQAVLFVVCAVLLFLPRSNRFFEGTALKVSASPGGPEEDAKETNSPSQSTPAS